MFASNKSSHVRWRRGWLAAILVAVAVGLTACGNGYAPGSSALAWGDFEAMAVSARLAPDTPAEYAYFASSIAVDEDTVVVGAWGEQDRGRNTGAVYVFDFTERGWEQRARLTASAAEGGTRFGHSVAVDGDTILVGAVYDGAYGFRSGAVYVFERVGGEWLERGTLEPHVRVPDAFFGSAVALDDGTAVVGASGPGARAAHVFARDGDAWVEEAMLAPRELETVARFGTSVAISGTRIIVGAPAVDDDLDDDRVPGGAAYLFHRSGGTWLEDAALTSPTSPEPEFGSSVAISGDTAAVGGPGEAERVHVFELRNDEWMPVASLGSGFEDGTEHFGAAVALEEDTIVVGAPGRDSHAGTAYIFVRVSDEWKGDARVIAPGATSPIELAGAVALSRGTVLLGATGDDDGGTAAGAAYAVESP